LTQPDHGGIVEPLGPLEERRQVGMVRGVQPQATLPDADHRKKRCR
jgi:hypothetical protein